MLFTWISNRLRYIAKKEDLEGTNRDEEKARSKKALSYYFTLI